MGTVQTPADGDSVAGEPVGRASGDVPAPSGILVVAVGVRILRTEQLTAGDLAIMESALRAAALQGHYYTQAPPDDLEAQLHVDRLAAERRRILALADVIGQS